MQWLADGACPCAGVLQTSVLIPAGTVCSFFASSKVDHEAQNQIDTYVARTRDALMGLVGGAELDESVLRIWLANFVEAVMADAVGVANVASLLVELDHCFA